MIPISIFMLYIVCGIIFLYIVCGIIFLYIVCGIILLYIVCGIIFLYIVCGIIFALYNAWDYFVHDIMAVASATASLRFPLPSASESPSHPPGLRSTNQHKSEALGTARAVYNIAFCSAPC